MYHAHTSGALALELLDDEELFGADTEGISGAAPSAEAAQKVAELEQSISELKEQLKEAHDLSLRSRADLENQRRRFQKEKEDLRKYAKEELMRDLINPMDHFAIALHSLESATDLESVRKGVMMIHREFGMVLKQSGLSELNPVGELFDPNLHDAVSTDYDPEKEEGVILVVSRPGWELKGRVLRPAMVQVNRKKVQEHKSGSLPLDSLKDEDLEIEPGSSE